MFCYQRTPLGVLAGLLTAISVVWLESLLRHGYEVWQLIVSLANG